LKSLKRFIIKIVFFILGRALKVIQKVDRDVSAYFQKLPDEISFGFKVNPNGPCLNIFSKQDKITYSTQCTQDTQILFSFKNLLSAFLVFTGQKSTIEAYAENRISVKGDIGDVMYIMRIMDRVQVLLFPKFIAKKVVKQYPDLGTFQILSRKIKLILGILFG